MAYDFGARMAGPGGNSGSNSGRQETEKLKVFISYSRDDLNFASQLFEALTLTGFAPEMDRHNIPGGSVWWSHIVGMIRDNDTIAFALSPSSAVSKTCKDEVDEAVKFQKRILPVVCRPLDGARPWDPLPSLDYIFFFDNEESKRDPSKPVVPMFASGLARLVKALNEDRDWIAEHTRLLRRATEWSAAERKPIRLLSGDDITAAKEWAARRPMNAPDLTELHIEYFRASEEEERRRKDQAERDLEERTRALAAAQDALAAAEVAQHDRETALAEWGREQKAREDALRERNEEQKRREAEQKKSSRLKGILLSGATAASVIFGGLALVSWNLKNDADAAKVLAEQRYVVAGEQTKIAKEKAVELIAAQSALARAKSELEYLLSTAQRNLEALLRPLAQEALRKGDHIVAALLALEGSSYQTVDWDTADHKALNSILNSVASRLNGRATAVVLGDGVDVGASSANRKVISADSGNTAFSNVAGLPTGPALIDYMKSIVWRCLTPTERLQYQLNDTDAPEWCHEMSKWPYKPQRFGFSHEDVTDSVKDRLKLASNDGRIVTRVKAGLPAEAAGLQRDDIIAAADGVAITSSDEFSKQLDAVRSGGSVRLKIIRNGEVREIEIRPR